MHLPEEVVNLIRAYSKPLPRVKISTFMHRDAYLTIPYIRSKYERYIQRTTRHYTLEQITHDKTWTFIVRTPDIHSTLSFTLDDLFAWNGSTFDCLENNFQTLYLSQGYLLFTYLCSTKLRLLKTTTTKCCMYKIYV